RRLAGVNALLPNDEEIESMSELTLDQTALSQLRAVKDSAKIIDESGRLLGYFIPAVDRELYEGLEVPVSNEELRRAERETKSYSTAEVIAHLNTLGTP